MEDTTVVEDTNEGRPSFLFCPSLVWDQILKNVGLADMMALRGTCSSTLRAVDQYFPLEKMLENKVVEMDAYSLPLYLEEVETLPFSNFRFSLHEERLNAFGDQHLDDFLHKFGQKVRKLTMSGCFLGKDDVRFLGGLSFLKELQFTISSRMETIECLKLLNSLSEITSLEELSLSVPYNTSPDMFTNGRALRKMTKLKSLKIVATSSVELIRNQSRNPKTHLITTAVLHALSCLHLEKLVIRSDTLYWKKLSTSGIVSLTTGSLAKSIIYFDFPTNVLQNALRSHRLAFGQSLVAMHKITNNNRRRLGLEPYWYSKCHSDY